MARGGARNRSGPQADPQSGRSERRKFVLSALPADGYDGVVPDFPIPADSESELLRERELDLWVDAWRTPQACAWSMQAWRNRIIAQYCRLAAMVELSDDPGPGLIGQLHRFRDQLGLTPAGLKENGWSIAESAVKLEAVPVEAARPPQRRRSREMAS